MAKNIFGNNAIKSNVEFNFVAAYITQAEQYYNTDYNVREPSTDKQAIAEESFVGFLHTTRGEGILIFPDKRITVHKNDLVFLRWRDLIAMITKNSEWDFYCLWFHLNNLTLEFEKVFSFTVMTISFSMIFYKIEFYYSVWVSIFSFLGASNIYNLMKKKNMINYNSFQKNDDNDKKVDK